MAATLTARRTNRTQPLTPAERNLRRKLIFQDSLALLALTIISICIAVLTYFFFHSFREHRAVLEKRWFSRGEKALSAGKPQHAVEDFRSALALSAANPQYELSLAEALAASNRNEEAYAYFSSLHDAEPGDGFLNLQLARLAVKRNDPAQAIAYYRSALTGLWHGKGAEQRFQIRLELAKYLMSQGKNTDAQGDLLTAEGNSLDHPAELLQVAALLRQADDPSDAWTTYRRVELHYGTTPSQLLESLLAESEVAQTLGQYKRAAQALERYLAKSRQHPRSSTPQQRQGAEQQLDRLQRMLELIPFYGLPPKQHAARILSGAGIAHKRYISCAAQFQSPNGSIQNLSVDDAAALSSLGTQWTQLSRLEPAQLAKDPALQQNLLQWTNATEKLTAEICGTPAGDDALLLQLAETPDKSE